MKIYLPQIAIIVLITIIFFPLTILNAEEGTIQYIYDAAGNRVQKIMPDGSVRTIIGPYSEIDEHGNIINHIYAGDTLISTTDQNGTHYYTHDHLGSPNIITNEAGEIEQRIDYNPLGAERLNEKTGFDSEHSFTGQKKDDESGLLYYGARYYDPKLGRFTQPDPVVVENVNRPEFQEVMQNPQLLNSYSYTANNPVKYVDPTGEYLLAPKWRATRDIKQNREHIINAANQFDDITPEMVGAVIYQERYGAWNVNPLDMADVPLGFMGVDTSIGLGQVKISTAQKMIDQGYMPGLDTYNWEVAGFDFSSVMNDEQKITMLLSNEEYNTQFVAAYLQYHIDQWKDKYPNITDDDKINILATLYNRVEVEPHANPGENDFGKKVKENFEHVKSILRDE
jgi:RHS repeat-associated protein